MHIEIQVALNFVISYLYNKLPRRRVNIFGEELEKALKDKFQGHWYPDKPFKGSAFRCLKTGDPIDSVLERAARESGVPIADILENLPHELSVWVDPGEVSYRIGEKNSVKILYSENSDNLEDITSADCEVNTTFNPEAQCFRPIEVVNSNMNNLSLSPKTSPQSGSSPHSASSNSPTYKGSPNPGATSAGAYMQRPQAPLTFTTATFAQTKFGSTKLKSNSKRTNSSSYRMSPTEFSNYIKQRAVQQQLHLGPGSAGGAPGTPQPNHFGSIGPVSPARSLSPNPLALNLGQSTDFFFPNIGMGIYPQYNGHRTIFEPHYHPETNAIYSTNNPGAGVGGGGGGGVNAAGQGKFNSYLEPHGFYGLGNHNMPQQQQQQQQQQQSQQAPQAAPKQQLQNGNTKIVGGPISSACAAVAAADTAIQETNGHQKNNNNANHVIKDIKCASGNTDSTPPNAATPATNAAATTAASVPPAAAPAVTANNPDSNSSKLLDGLNSFYSNATGSYQQLLVAN